MMCKKFPTHSGNFLHVQEISCTCRKKQQNVQSLIMLKINVSYLNENMFITALYVLYYRNVTCVIIILTC